MAGARCHWTTGYCRHDMMLVGGSDCYFSKRGRGDVNLDSVLSDNRVL